jgi:hypothetical protein
MMRGAQSASFPMRSMGKVARSAGWGAQTTGRASGAPSVAIPRHLPHDVVVGEDPTADSEDVK